MKKERDLLFCLVFLVVAYFVLLFLGGQTKNWFSVALFFLSVYMSIKSYFFKSDSSLFFAVLLLQLSIVYCANLNYILPFLCFVSIFGFCVTFAFFVNFLVFGKKTVFWLFLLNFLLNLPIFLYSIYCINLLLMLLFLCGVLMLAMALVSAKKYGKI